MTVPAPCDNNDRHRWRRRLTDADIVRMPRDVVHAIEAGLAEVAGLTIVRLDHRGVIELAGDGDVPRWLASVTR